jgi:hypothetical protein
MEYFPPKLNKPYPTLYVHLMTWSVPHCQVTMERQVHFKQSLIWDQCYHHNTREGSLSIHAIDSQNFKILNQFVRRNTNVHYRIWFNEFLLSNPNVPFVNELMRSVSPFWGVRVYTRSAMGMHRSETALEEWMCRVLSDLVKEGVVVKLANGLYFGWNPPDDLLYNCKRVLNALQACNTE